MIYPSLALCLCHYRLFPGSLLTRACPARGLEGTGGCGQPSTALGSPLLLMAPWFLPKSISSDGHHTEQRRTVSPPLMELARTFPSADTGRYPTRRAVLLPGSTEKELRQKEGVAAQSGLQSKAVTGKWGANPWDLVPGSKHPISSSTPAPTSVPQD